MSNPKEKSPGPADWPDWFTGSNINESAFCLQFVEKHKLAYTENAFFTPRGRLDDETQLQRAIYAQVMPYVTTNMNRKINNLIELMKIIAKTDSLPPQTDRIHLSNGTLFLDGRFVPGCGEIVRSRFPVAYVPNPEPPRLWLRFLSELLYEEDIPTLQEFIGYCLIPSNKGQRMMVIKGNGGEGKSQVGAVLFRLFGDNAKDGSVGKISENAFARADIESTLLMIDDDMRLEALKQTNYVKSIVTAKGKMDLERKGKQSYQGWMYARMLAFSNGDLTALYDRSDGFFRRQLILTARGRRPDRVDDPFLSDKLCEEIPGIFNWAFEGLKRLIANGFRFTESERAKQSREEVRQENNNILQFMNSKGYIQPGENLRITSKNLVRAYRSFCAENALPAMRSRSVLQFLKMHQDELGLDYTNHMLNEYGQEVRGFRGVGLVMGLPANDRWSMTEEEED